MNSPSPLLNSRPAISPGTGGANRAVCAARLLLLAGSLSATAALLQGCLPVVAAGVGTAAVVAADRRQPDTVLGDQRIELTAGNRLGERLRDQIHANVTSYNYTALITGEAATEQVKAEAEKIVAGVPSVKNVVNELQVAGASSLASRSNDTYLTGRVKAAYVAAGKFDITAVKVVTEAAVVYLMGSVSQKEAEDATEIARGISGVRKVVRIFEYPGGATAASAAAPASK
ncbi:MAG TPA: BON domain-containing protein [Burkholderiales bacterium]|nr:BON domain-containing protein [Burkholderiales bacterium]